MSDSFTGGEQEHERARFAEASGVAASPATPAEQLAGVVYSFPSLGAVVAANPAAYPALLDWLASYGDADAREAVRARRAAPAVEKPAAAAPTASAPWVSAAPPAPVAPWASAAPPAPATAAAPWASAAPPIPGIPTTAGWATAAAPTGPAYAQPAGSVPPTGDAAPWASTPPPKKSRAALWISIGAIALILILVGGTVGVVSVVNGIAAARSGNGPTFTESDATGVMLNQTQTVRLGGVWGEPETEASTVVSAVDELKRTWSDDNPASGAAPCRFAYSTFPVIGDEKASARTEPLSLNTGFLQEGSNSGLSQSTRVFASTGEAEQYLTHLRETVSGCTHYSTDSWSATVSPLALDGVSLGNAGWVEKGDGDSAGSYYYAVDIQRGNLVTRVSGAVSADDAGALTRSLFTQVGVVAAQNLSSLSNGSSTASGASLPGDLQPGASAPVSGRVDEADEAAADTVELLP